MSPLTRLPRHAPSVRAVTSQPEPKTPALTATLDRVHPGAGLSTGALALNGRTYRFNSGQADSAAIPVGTYVVRRGALPANAAAFTSSGVAFVYWLDGTTKAGAASAPRTGQAWDPRLGRMRTELRLRPDIGEPGTAGALGIVGTKDELQRLVRDLDEALRREGGTVTLVVR